MICVDSNGQAIEISVADQMWLDDAYFKGKQMHLEADAPRVALAYRVSTKGQVDHDDIPMQKIDCRKFAQKQGWRVVKEVAEKGVSGSKVSASKRDAIQQLKEDDGQQFCSVAGRKCSSEQILHRNQVPCRYSP